MTLTSSSTARRRTAFYPLRVERVERLCEDAASVSLAVPSDLEEAFQFRPGQYLTLRRYVDGREERRSYSICAPAGAPLRIGVRELPGGAVSSWLINQVGPGDLIDVQIPAGSFTPDLGTPGRHVLIAAGSGITPVLSIAASVLADGRSEALLLYGNRRSDSIMFAEDIADLKDRHLGRMQVVNILSREGQEVELHNGRIDGEKLRTLLPPICDPHQVDHWWLCGPFAMVEETIKVLTDLGVQPDRIHRELFYVEAAPPPPARRIDDLTEGAEVTVQLDGRATTTTVPWDVAVLDGAQRVRPDLPFACKGGVCGTCRAKVLEGDVQMRRNFALEPSEVEAGYVLTCQSVCITAAVTVDYDA
jgi:ring-1,2-phenylacetyl-CoA epoxidase subunit PaaE